ncbi:MAG: RNA polymerase sigma factor [Lachnospiraceae bacterium]
MRKYQNSDYAVNKYREGLVYQFADGEVEISLESYLNDNPDKTEQDFLNLKAISDEIYYEQDREETRYAKRRYSLERLEESEQMASPSPYILLFQKFDEENALAAASELLQSGKLTEIQKRRFILHFFQELSYRQIAEQEQVNFAAVRDSIKWAVKKLKKIFEKL